MREHANEGIVEVRLAVRPRRSTRSARTRWGCGGGALVSPRTCTMLKRASPVIPSVSTLTRAPFRASACANAHERPCSRIWPVCGGACARWCAYGAGRPARRASQAGSPQDSRPSASRSHPSDEFGGREGLDDVVGGAALRDAGARVVPAAHRKEDDRNYGDSQQVPISLTPERAAGSGTYSTGRVKTNRAPTLGPSLLALMRLP